MAGLDPGIWNDRDVYGLVMNLAVGSNAIVVPGPKCEGPWKALGECHCWLVIDLGSLRSPEWIAVRSRHDNRMELESQSDQ